MKDPYDLQRFLDAQKPVFQTVCGELQAGRKQSHWMWFIFPQIKGLGQSEMARKYAISSLEEARAYLAHPVLGPRLREASRLAAQVHGRGAHEIFAPADAVKFRSCMTLFARAGADNAIFNECLAKYYGGQADPLTLARI